MGQSGESVRESSGISQVSRIKVRNSKSWLCPLSPSLIPASLRRDTYYTINSFAPDGVIYFLGDVPHLVNAVTNNLEDSHDHQNTKSLMKDGQMIRWPDIVSTVKENLARELVQLPRMGLAVRVRSIRGPKIRVNVPPKGPC